MVVLYMMAGVTGFEPVLTVLETAVLPLTPHPYAVTAFVLYKALSFIALTNISLAPLLHSS